MASLWSYLEWFRTLPLIHETDRFRAVHACWDHDHVALLKRELGPNGLTDAVLHRSVVKGSSLYKAIEETLKGKEVPLPNAMRFDDKDGHSRSEMRIKWWVDPVGATYHDMSIPTQHDLPVSPIDHTLLRDVRHYTSDERPVFFGHYWLMGTPSLFRANVCCLDYSVAKKGKLVAYRLDEESQLESNKLVFV